MSESADELDAGLWNLRVEQTPLGSYRQSTSYAEFQAKCRHERPVYFRAVDAAGRTVGQLQAIEGAAFGWGLARRPLSKVSLPLARRMIPRLYWHEGPLVLVGELFTETYRSLIEAATNYGRKHGCVSISGNPSFLGEEAAQFRDTIRTIHEDLGFAAAEMQTPIVRTDRDEDELWSGVRRDGRTKVKKARSQDVQIARIGRDPVLRRLAYDIVRETSARNATAIDSFADFSRSLEHLYRHDVGEAFLSLHAGRPVSFQRVVFYNGHAALGGVSYSDYSRDQKVYGNDLMQWHMIMWAREKGMVSLDYGGAEPNADDPKMKGIFDFKMKWGAQLVSFDSFEMRPKNRPTGHMYSWIRSVLSGRS